MAKVETEHSKSEATESGHLLKKAARAIGSAVGIAAAKTGLAHSSETQGPRMINGKFQNAHKHRLPRKIKKLRRKTVQGPEAGANA